MEAFPKVFTGLGKIKGAPIQIQMYDGATPYQLSAPRRVPLPLLEPLKAELKRMEDLGVIRKVKQPTEWCHSIVVVQNPVSEKLRICLDLTKLNESYINWRPSTRQLQNRKRMQIYEQIRCSYNL